MSRWPARVARAWREVAPEGSDRAVGPQRGWRLAMQRQRALCKANCTSKNRDGVRAFFRHPMRRLDARGVESTPTSLSTSCYPLSGIFALPLRAFLTFPLVRFASSSAWNYQTLHVDANAERVKRGGAGARAAAQAPGPFTVCVFRRPLRSPPAPRSCPSIDPPAYSTCGLAGLAATRGMVLVSFRLAATIFFW